MSETEHSPEELEAFRGEFRDAVESNVLIIVTRQDEGPFTLDPFSLGIGEESLPETSPERISVIKEELADLLGRTAETEPVAAYASDDITVKVFEGFQEDEQGTQQPYYLHELEYPDGNNEWQLSNAPDPVL